MMHPTGARCSCREGCLTCQQSSEPQGNAPQPSSQPGSLNSRAVSWVLQAYEIMLSVVQRPCAVVL